MVRSRRDPLDEAVEVEQGPRAGTRKSGNSGLLTGLSVGGAFLLLLGGGCGPAAVATSPTYDPVAAGDSAAHRAFDAYKAALIHQDWGRMYDGLSAASQKQIDSFFGSDGREGFLKKAKNQEDPTLKLFRLSQVPVAMSRNVTMHEQGDTATAKYDYDERQAGDPAGQDRSGQTTLVREGGNWKVQIDLKKK